MKLKELNPEYIQKFPELVSIYITILKNTKALKEFDENTRRQFFTFKDLTPTIKDELIEQFQSIVNAPIDFYNSLKPLTETLSAKYPSVFYSARSKQGDNDTVDSLMSSRNIKYILIDGLEIVEEALGDNKPMARAYNRLYTTSINKLIDIGNSLVYAIQKELSLEYNSNCTNDFDHNLMNIRKAADNYDLRELIGKHKTENVIQILNESISFNIKSAHRANILNFISDLVGSPAAYNKLENTIPVNSKEITLDIIKRMAYMLLSIRHYSASRLRIASIDNKRAHECLLNVQKEIAGIRFNKAEAVFASDIEDETITDGIVIHNGDDYLFVKVIKFVIEDRENYYSTLYLTTNQNVNYNFATDMEKIDELLSEDDVLEYLGKLSIEFFIELYRMDSDYLDTYYNKANEAVIDTSLKFRTVVELLIDSNLDSNKINEILLDNKTLDVTLAEICSNENLMGSTSDEEQKKDLVRIATMIAIYIGDLKHGSAE